MVCMVAIAFAIFALARDYMSPAGAAAVVAGIFAVLSVILALTLSGRIKTKAPAPAADESLLTRAMLLAKERPFVAAALGAVAAGVLIRNPAILSTLLSAAIAGRAAKPDR